MVGSIEDVEESQVDEAQRGLAPSRVQPDQAGVAGEFEGPHRTPSGEKPEYRNHVQTKSSKLRVDRKRGSIRLNGVFEPYVEHGLVPDHVGVVGEFGPRDVRQRLLIG